MNMNTASTLSASTVTPFDNHKMYTEAEVLDLMESYETQLAEKDHKIATLENINYSLTAQLEAKHHEACDNCNGTPLLVYGQETDLYDGEIREIVLDILRQSTQGKTDGTRRSDIVKDLLTANHFHDEPRKRHKKAKAALRGYTSVTNVLRRELADIGFIIDRQSGHPVLTYYNDPRYQITMAKTCSDHRAGDNLAAVIANLAL